MSISTRQKLAGLGVAAAVMLGSGGAMAWAQTDGGSTTTTPAAPGAPAPSTAKGAHRGLRALRAFGRGAVHGDVIVKDKDGKYVTVTFDRGTVESASATSVTLDRPDGQKATLSVTSDTKVHGVASAAALAIGKDALVVSRAGTATHIAQRPNA